MRPPGVYGPRDGGFLSLFKAVKAHVLPRFNSRQGISLVYVKDLAEAVVRCLDHPAVAGKTFFVAAREVVTGQGVAREIAAQMKRWTLGLPLPAAALWPACLACELGARLTGKASLLSLAKYPELKAPGWVCDPTRLERELGYRCATTLKEGVAAALSWYRKEGWL